MFKYFTLQYLIPLAIISSTVVGGTLFVSKVIREKAFQKRSINIEKMKKCVDHKKSEKKLDCVEY